jgi:3'-phosphoadenosine 5'-phosphosulfate sulfotransferase (PAPS reductase)/FAD synthetase
MSDMLLEDYQVRQRVGMPLDAKIEWANRAIRTWYDRWDGMVYVAYSAGLDSTALLHLVRSMFPEVPAVFWDTGLEFPEIRALAKETENCEMRRPKMTFRQVIDKYGYPVVSKRVAQYVHEARTGGEGSNIYRLRTEGIRKDGSFSPMTKISNKWQFLIDAPFRVSDKCCLAMKKRPSAQYEKETGRKAIVGVCATESNQRWLTYRQYGCNSFDTKRPRSWPLAIWTRANVTEYIRENAIPYAAVYDMGYTRTGCMFCAFGAHLRNPNQFERLAETHPKIWLYCMNQLGMAPVLNACGVAKGDPDCTQRRLFDVNSDMVDSGHAIEREY